MVEIASGTSVQRWSTVYGQAANFNGALTAGSGTLTGSVTPSVDSTYDLGENYKSVDEYFR